ncbi:MAG: oxygen-independent coproporphyrinogen III oxidase [Clostridiaceae bacterium]|nr:oxygen-independent coproporphyrinogen III oxidase [Clostridiaceae bacterium]
MGERKLGLYIHIPFCQKKCNYCDFTSYPNMESYWEVYITALTDELKLISEKFQNSIISTVFIGGGTPSLLPPVYIEQIFECIYKFYNVETNCEISIETNPGTLSAPKLKTYRDAGINRLSIGLQACQDVLLKKLGRIHTFDDFINAVNMADKFGFDNINADIIFGIPEQSLSDWKETINLVTALGLTHISCYSLLIEEGTVFGDLKEKGLIKEADDILDREMYHYAKNYFSEKGYKQYEISNFAKPQYQCLHNMNYWERGEYIGIGAGAHSLIKNRRYANIPDVLDYIEGIRANTPVLAEDTLLSLDEALAEKMILGLRLNKGVDLRKVSEEFGVDVVMRYEKSIDTLLKKNLIEIDQKVIKLTERGFDLANSVFVEFI